MHRRGWRVRLEQRVQLVVQWAEPLHDGDVLRDRRKPRAVLRVVESLGEPRRELVDVSSEDRHEPAGNQDTENLFEVVLGRRLRAGSPDSGLLAQDRSVELLELLAGLDAELVDEDVPGVLKRPERLGLPTRPVEREHQLCAQPFAQWMALDERLELSDELRGAPGGELRVEPFFENRQQLLLQPGDLRPREGVERKIGERRTALQCEGLSQLLGALCGVESGACPLHEQAESIEIELLRTDVERVSRRFRHQHVGAEGLAQL